MHGKINLCGELSNMFSLHTAEEPGLGAGAGRVLSSERN